MGRSLASPAGRLRRVSGCTRTMSMPERLRDYAKSTAVPPDPPPLAGYTFQGFRRADGRVGTRNYVAVISNVNCSASVSKYIARRFDAAALREFPNVDGVVAFTYGGGCGIPYGGEYHQILTRVLGGHARHPNIGGYVLVGLGCETNTIGHLIDEQKLVQIDGHRSASGSDQSLHPLTPALSGGEGPSTTTGAGDAGSRRHGEDGGGRGKIRRGVVAAGQFAAAGNRGGERNYSRHQLRRVGWKQWHYG